MIRSLPATRMMTWLPQRLALIGALAVPMMACVEDASDPQWEEADLVLDEELAEPDTASLDAVDDRARVISAAVAQTTTISATKSGSPTITCTITAYDSYKDALLNRMYGRGAISCSGANVTQLGLKIRMFRGGFYFGETSWSYSVNPGKYWQRYYERACSNSSTTYWRARADYYIKFPSGYSRTTATGTVTGDVVTIPCG